MGLSAGPRHGFAFDEERSHIFLEKADHALPDPALRVLRSSDDEALGIDAAFLRDATGAFGIAPTARISRAGAQGTFHRLYEVRERDGELRLLRVAVLGNASAADLMALECAIMTALRREGFPVPSCVFRKVTQHEAVRGVHLLERAVGVSLTAADGDEPEMRIALGWVARFLAELHRIHGIGFGPISLTALQDPARTGRSHFAGVHRHWDDYVWVRFEEHLRSCETCGAITTREGQNIVSRFVAARPTLRAVRKGVLLHGDPGSHNFMIDKSGIRAVIDWEDALLGDPLFDLASLCTFHPARRHAAIWSAYGATLPPGGETWTRFWLYFLRIALAKTVHRHRFAYGDRPGRPPASQRIQLALQRLDEAG